MKKISLSIAAAVIIALGAGALPALQSRAQANSADLSDWMHATSHDRGNCTVKGCLKTAGHDHGHHGHTCVQTTTVPAVSTQTKVLRCSVSGCGLTGEHTHAAAIKNNSAAASKKEQKVTASSSKSSSCGPKHGHGGSHH